MYKQLASRLALSGVEYSPSVAMSGGNAVQVESVNYASGTASVQLQVSNDMENWLDEGAAMAVAPESYATAEHVGIASAYVRLKYTATSGKSVLAAGVNVANL